MTSVSSPLGLVEAKFSYHPQDDDELSFSKGDIIKAIVKSEDEDDWWRGQNIITGQTGLFPVAYSTPYTSEGIAKFDFEARSKDELSFSAGDRLAIFDIEDPDWCWGRLKRKAGIVPVKYLKLDKKVWSILLRSLKQSEEDEGEQKCSVKKSATNQEVVPSNPRDLQEEKETSAKASRPPTHATGSSDEGKAKGRESGREQLRSLPTKEREGAQVAPISRESDSSDTSKGQPARKQQRNLSKSSPTDFDGEGSRSKVRKHRRTEHKDESCAHQQEHDLTVSQSKADIAHESHETEHTLNCSSDKTTSPESGYESPSGSVLEPTHLLVKNLNDEEEASGAASKRDEPTGKRQRQLEMEGHADVSSPKKPPKNQTNLQNSPHSNSEDADLGDAVEDNSESEGVPDADEAGDFEDEAAWEESSSSDDNDELQEMARELMSNLVKPKSQKKKKQKRKSRSESITKEVIDAKEQQEASIVKIADTEEDEIPHSALIAVLRQLGKLKGKVRTRRHNKLARAGGAMPNRSDSAVKLLEGGETEACCNESSKASSSTEKVSSNQADMKGSKSIQSEIGLSTIVDFGTCHDLLIVKPSPEDSVANAVPTSRVKDTEVQTFDRTEILRQQLSDAKPRDSSPREDKDTDIPLDGKGQKVSEDPPPNSPAKADQNVDSGKHTSSGEEIPKEQETAVFAATTNAAQESSKILSLSLSFLNLTVTPLESAVSIAPIEDVMTPSTVAVSELPVSVDLELSSVPYTMARTSCENVKPAECTDYGVQTDLSMDQQVSVEQSKKDTTHLTVDVQMTSLPGASVTAPIQVAAITEDKIKSTVASANPAFTKVQLAVGSPEIALEQRVARFQTLQKYAFGKNTKRAAKEAIQPATLEEEVHKGHSPEQDHKQLTPARKDPQVKLAGKSKISNSSVRRPSSPSGENDNLTQGNNFPDDTHTEQNESVRDAFPACKQESIGRSPGRQQPKYRTDPKSGAEPSILCTEPANDALNNRLSSHGRQNGKPVMKLANSSHPAQQGRVDDGVPRLPSLRVRQEDPDASRMRAAEHDRSLDRIKQQITSSIALASDYGAVLLPFSLTYPSRGRIGIQRLKQEAMDSLVDGGVSPQIRDDSFWNEGAPYNNHFNTSYVQDNTLLDAHHLEQGSVESSMYEGKLFPSVRNAKVLQNSPQRKFYPASINRVVGQKFAQDRTNVSEGMVPGL